MLTTASTAVSGNIRQDAAEIERALTTASTAVTGSLRQETAEVERVLTTASTAVTGSLRQETAEAERVLDHRVRPSASTGSACRRSAQPLRRASRRAMLTTASTSVSDSLRQDAAEVERVLTTASSAASGHLRQDAAMSSAR